MSDVFEGVVIHPPLEPTDADAIGDDLFVDLVVVVSATIAVEKADHFFPGPSRVVDALAHEVVVAADPVGIVGDVISGQ